MSVTHQINRGDEVEVVFGEGVEPLTGTVVNAPHREESHEKLGWIIKLPEWPSRCFLHCSDAPRATIT